MKEDCCGLAIPRADLCGSKQVDGTWKGPSDCLTDILANGVSINKSSLKYNQNNLTFCFTDFAYGLPSALLYEYKLEERTVTGSC